MAGITIETTAPATEWSADERERVRQLAREVAWAEHRETVAGVVDDLIAGVKAGRITSADELADEVSQACDGVIVYSRDCAEFLSASDHEDDWREMYDGGTEPEDYIRAAIALEGDVRDALDERGYGVDGEAWDETTDDAEEVQATT